MWTTRQIILFSPVLEDAAFVIFTFIYFLTDHKNVFHSSSALKIFVAKLAVCLLVVGLFSLQAKVFEFELIALVLVLNCVN